MPPLRVSEPRSSVQMSRGLAACEVLWAAQQFLCHRTVCWFRGEVGAGAVVGRRWGAGGVPELGAGAQTGAAQGAGQPPPPRTSPPQPSLGTTRPAHCGPGKKEEQSAGPGSRWRCISPGLPPSPPLPSAEAPAVPACSLELKAKPAVESAALAHWGLIPAPGGQQPPPPPPELSESRAPTPAPGIRGVRAV